MQNDVAASVCTNE